MVKLVQFPFPVDIFGRVQPFDALQKQERKKKARGKYI